MHFDEAMMEAAKTADRAVNNVMRRYREGKVTDEPEITGEIMGQLVARFDEKPIGGLRWSGSIMRNKSGEAAQELRTGADLMIHVEVKTPTINYSKGVLIQAKRAEPDERVKASEISRLNGQCNKMLDHTASSFVFTYAKGSMRCGSATRFTASQDPRLYKQCTWTSYRFFLELFRCPIGDPNIVGDTVNYLPVPKIIKVTGSGEAYL